ncbi:2-oxoglutarate and iron-dependent oxygenase domain-containing protein, partial [Rhodopseudomonas sp.]|uniref:2-oxoglutarate and iron-dependent oxygenase domain-containing protein n=1 Tax=Rhodopseudomonas sp. TaxID=1078 RepID=UPI003B3AD833
MIIRSGQLRQNKRRAQRTGRSRGGAFSSAGSTAPDDRLILHGSISRSHFMPAIPPTLPILDLTRFSGHAADRTGFLQDVRAAAFGPGFFYLTGHGISDRLIRDVLIASRNFFSLSEAEKLAIEMINSPHFRG